MRKKYAFVKWFAVVISLIAVFSFGKTVFSAQIRPSRYIPVHNNKGIGLVEALLFVLLGAVVASVVASLVLAVVRG